MHLGWNPAVFKSVCGLQTYFTHSWGMISTAQSQSSEKGISCLTALYPEQSTFPPIIFPPIFHAATSLSCAVTIIPIQNSAQSGSGRHTGTLPRGCGAPALDLDAATLQMRTSSTWCGSCERSRTMACLNSSRDFYQTAVIAQCATCGWPDLCHSGNRQNTLSVFADWPFDQREAWERSCRKCSSDLQTILPVIILTLCLQTSKCIIFLVFVWHTHITLDEWRMISSFYHWPNYPYCFPKT